jgi:hypothetical protein
MYNSVSMLRQQIKPSARIHGIISKGGAPRSIIHNRQKIVFCVFNDSMDA